MSVKKDLHGKNVRLSPKTSNIMAPAVNSLVSALNNTNNNDESDSDVLKIDEDGDNNTNVTKDASEDDIAEVENENGLDDSEEEIAMGNKEIAERTGKILKECVFVNRQMPANIFFHYLLKYFCQEMFQLGSSTRGLEKKYLHQSQTTTRTPCTVR